MLVFPNCKINLGLHILQKRADGFHDLETVFYPLVLKDALEMIRNPDPQAAEPVLSLSGNSLDAPPSSNSCVKAWQLLKKDFPSLPAVLMHLHKVIPSGAGLGGGSADGAFALIQLNRQFQLGLTDETLQHYALQLGSDCPFFLANRPALATGRGEVLKTVDLNLSAYKIVLIHPNIHVSTPWAFSRIKPQKDRVSIEELIQEPVQNWKDLLVNDFEPVVFAEYPAIARLKEHLYHAGALYASMSGSGSSVYGLFDKEVVTNQWELPASYFVRVV